MTTWAPDLHKTPSPQLSLDSDELGPGSSQNDGWKSHGGIAHNHGTPILWVTFQSIAVCDEEGPRSSQKCSLTRPSNLWRVDCSQTVLGRLGRFNTQLTQVMLLKLVTDKLIEPFHRHHVLHHMLIPNQGLWPTTLPQPCKPQIVHVGFCTEQSQPDLNCCCPLADSLGQVPGTKHKHNLDEDWFSKFGAADRSCKLYKVLSWQHLTITGSPVQDFAPYQHHFCQHQAQQQGRMLAKT